MAGAFDVHTRNRPASWMNIMARNNYSAGKRQRELDKARKKKEKAARKLERRTESAGPQSENEEPSATADE
jgi:hypothetical protein